MQRKVTGKRKHLDNIISISKVYKGTVYSSPIGIIVSF